MSAAIDITFSRLQPEEEYEQYPYNDRTGKRVTCVTNDPATTGSLTWLYGLNLETAGSHELAELIARWWLGKLELQLLMLPWYANLDSVRQSVCLDVAFNAGFHGLLGYPKMIAALSNSDWATASAECTTSTPGLQTRYATLAQILLTGIA